MICDPSSDGIIDDAKRCYTAPAACYGILVGVFQRISCGHISEYGFGDKNMVERALATVIDEVCREGYISRLAVGSYVSMPQRTGVPLGVLVGASVMSDIHIEVTYEQLDILWV